MTHTGSASLKRYHDAKKGYSATRVARLKANLHASDDTMAKIVGVSRKTFILHSTTKSFNTLETERLLRTEEVLEISVELLGSLDSARKWLATPNRALGGEIPSELLQSPSGADAVFEVLMQIRHGIYA